MIEDEGRNAGSEINGGRGRKWECGVKDSSRYQPASLLATREGFLCGRS